MTASGVVCGSAFSLVVPYFSGMLGAGCQEPQVECGAEMNRDNKHNVRRDKDLPRRCCEGMLRIHGPHRHVPTLVGECEDSGNGSSSARKTP